MNIHNVSGRGMLLSAEDSPPMGSYLEVRRGSVAIVARIVWRSNGRFGVRSQDRIDLAQLTATKTPTAAVEQAIAGAQLERRHRARSDAPARSRHVGRLLQFGAVVAAIGMGVAALAGALTAALAPLREAQASLLGG